MRISWVAAFIGTAAVLAVGCGPGGFTFGGKPVDPGALASKVARCVDGRVRISCVDAVAAAARLQPASAAAAALEGAARQCALDSANAATACALIAYAESQ